MVWFSMRKTVSFYLSRLPNMLISRLHSKLQDSRKQTHHSGRITATKSKHRNGWRNGRLAIDWTQREILAEMSIWKDRINNYFLLEWKRKKKRRKSRTFSFLWYRVHLFTTATGYDVYESNNATPSRFEQQIGSVPEMNAATNSDITVDKYRLQVQCEGRCGKLYLYLCRLLHGLE